jgi:hypothetical protein
VRSQDNSTFESVRHQDNTTFESVRPQDNTTFESVRPQDNITFESVRPQDKTTFESRQGKGPVPAASAGAVGVVGLLWWYSFALIAIGAFVSPLAFCVWCEWDKYADDFKAKRNFWNRYAEHAYKHAKARGILRLALKTYLLLGIGSLLVWRLYSAYGKAFISLAGTGDDHMNAFVVFSYLSAGLINIGFYCSDKLRAMSNNVMLALATFATEVMEKVVPVPPPHGSDNTEP